MKTSLRPCLMVLGFCWLLAVSLYAQTAAPELNIALGEQRVKFAPTRSFQEMRLAVVNHVGETVFSQVTTDAEFNWNMRNGNGETLAPGLYSYALTVQYAADLTHRHAGHFIIEKGSDQVWLTAQDGAEVSGTALNVARTGGRSVAGLRTTEAKPAQREVSGRELVDDKGKPLTPGKDDKKAKQEKAALLGTQNKVAKFDAGGVNLIDSAMTDTGHVTIDSSTNMQAAGLGSLIIEGQSNKERVELRSAGGTPGPALQGKGFGGTIAAPTATLANTDLFIIGGSGHNGSGLVTFNAGTVKIKAEQTWTPTANGSYLNFETTPSGLPTSARAERMRITGAGNVGIGTTAPAAPLEVNGVLRSTRNGVAPQYLQLWGGDSASIRLTGQSTGGAEKPLLIQNLSGEAVPGANNSIFFQTGTTASFSTKMTIFADGNVGIGENAISSDKLRVHHNSHFGTAIYAYSDTGMGVEGASFGGSIGVRGTSTGGGFGVQGLNNTASTNAVGVNGYSEFGKGVWGNSESGTGVYGKSTTGYAGYFDGNTAVNGVLDVSFYTNSGTEVVCRNGARLAMCSSSLRYKTAVQPFRSGLSLLNRLRPISFNWKSNGNADLGLGAEDVAAVEPLLVTHNEKGEVEGVKYDRIGVVLINAVKEQQVIIQQQQTMMQKQQTTMRRLQRKLASLEKTVKQNRRADSSR